MRRDGDEFGNDYDDADWEWQRPKGIFVLVPIDGVAGEQIRQIRALHDPRLAAMNAPHITLIGSSGVGPIAPDTPRETLQRVFGDIASTTAPFEVAAEPPHRFVNTGIVSFPLPARGPLRALHERVVTSGLRFLQTRFAFAPHATISYYPEVSRAKERDLLALRLAAPIRIDRLELSLTNDPQPPNILLTLPLTG